ncbi:H-NS family nucleoid-associated regulatory protein, partial [Rodentibacter sp. JRC1]|uniref:H-NS histone family protein n=1 Tax=Rodentibacter sp. JRC1 TaxID=2874504 RepID=UPI001CFE23F0
LENKRLALIKELEEKGWRPEDLLNPVTQKAKARHTRKAKNKYVYVTEIGETQYWTGRGRMPATLKAQVESGKSLDSFLIQE